MFVQYMNNEKHTVNSKGNKYVFDHDGEVKEVDDETAKYIIFKFPKSFRACQSVTAETPVKAEIINSGFIAQQVNALERDEVLEIEKKKETTEPTFKRKKIKV